MGCTSSNSRCGKFNETATLGSDFDVRSLKAESYDRRKGQPLVENIVREVFEKEITDFYDLQNSAVLGVGVSGSVRTCTCRSTLQVFALKTLYKKKINSTQLSVVKQEISMMAKMDHPNILRIVECFETANEIFLILPLCKGGELLDRLNKQIGNKYTEAVACKYMKTIVGAIRYCHDHGICHRDLKLENFLFESDDPDSDLKLIDFGLSQYFKPHEVFSRPVGTPYYVAPEVLQGCYTSSCDIWGLGVIAYMLVSGKPPFYGEDEKTILLAVKEANVKFNDKYFSNISQEAKEFISSCLEKNGSLRPTAEQLLASSWFLKYEQGDSEPLDLAVVSRLNRFQKQSRLTKICMEVVAHTLSSEQIKDLKKTFMRLDVQGAGILSMKDFRTALEGHGSISYPDIQHIFEGIDFNKTKSIEYHEFVAAAVSQKNITDANIRVAFNLISNHGPNIGINDLQDLLGEDNQIGSMEDIMREMSISPSRKISFDEFKLIMRGGDSSPAVNSPSFKHRKQIAMFSSPATSPDRVQGRKCFVEGILSVSDPHNIANSR